LAADRGFGDGRAFAGLSPLFVKEVIRILSDLARPGACALIAEQKYRFLRSRPASLCWKAAHPLFRHGTEMTTTRRCGAPISGLK